MEGNFLKETYSPFPPEKTEFKNNLEYVVKGCKAEID